MAAAMTELHEDLRQLVLHIVEGIVDHEGEVEVSVRPREHYVTVELSTHLSDFGQVVGAGGQAISSIRTLIAAWGGKHRKQVNLVDLTERRKLSRHNSDREKLTNRTRPG